MHRDAWTIPTAGEVPDIDNSVRLVHITTDYDRHGHGVMGLWVHGLWYSTVAMPTNRIASTLFGLDSSLKGSIYIYKRHVNPYRL